MYVFITPPTLYRPSNAPPGRNEDYLALNKQFTIDVFMGAQIINLFPSFLKP